MEMRILSELSQRLLSDPEFCAQLNASTRAACFDACGSPREWADYVTDHAGEAVLPLLQVEYERIAARVATEHPARPHSTVLLPDF